ncbi:MAG: DMT family transporter [Pseudonocardiaceae bacterium]
MKAQDNVTGLRRETLGLLYGALGVLMFSVTLPATRVAVADLDPWVVGLGRAVVAAALALAVLVARGERPLPPRRIWGRLVIVAFGVVVGFPLFTALALRELGAAHSAVIVGVLPAATAVAAVARAGERPSGGFWLAALGGFVAALIFAITQGVAGVSPADGFVLLAVACAALGYAEGGVLAREYGGWQVICWALIVVAPVLVPVVAVRVVAHGLSAGPVAWLDLGYVTVFSMFLGFFAWYHGLALGGVARVGQVQLAQPLLTLAWSAVLLGERIGTPTIVAALAVLACVAATQRTRIQRVR